MNHLTIFTFLLLLSFHTSASKFDAQINMVNFPQEHEAKVYQAIDLIKKVVSSNEFRERIK